MLTYTHIKIEGSEKFELWDSGAGETKRYNLEIKNDSKKATITLTELAFEQLCEILNCKKALGESDKYLKRVKNGQSVLVR